MITWTGLAPHPPIIVDGVGGSRARAAASTIAACETLADQLVASKPDRLIVISPHTPRPRHGICGWLEGRLHGDFSRFGAASTRLSFPLDEAWIKNFTTRFPHVHALVDEPLDHGASVPLYFAARAGWSGPTAVIGLPWGDDGLLDQIGDAVAAVSSDQSRTALLASGDMSHCLKPGAPSGFDARGAIFDQAFTKHIRVAQYRDAVCMDGDLREAACQDVVESCRIVWQASAYADRGHQFLSYEGPFGVGYAVMRFSEVPCE